VVRLDAVEEVAASLGLDGLLLGGEMGPAECASFLRSWLGRCTRLHDPRYLGHQVAVPRWPAPLADLVHAVTNNGMAVYEMGPPAVAAELAVLRWMLSFLGWEEEGGGVLTHGGSLANLTALLAARAHAAPEAWTEGLPGDLVLLAPESCHYSVARAAGILGLGQRRLRRLPCDALGRLTPEGLEGDLHRAREEGLRPMAVVANACATATGLHDPLEETAALCREAGVWFHVDAAHGASALLSPRLRERLRGIEAADSLVWDAHKMLGVSTLCAAVLVRRDEDLPRAFQQQADYLREEQDRGPGPDLILRAVECTKAALGLKVLLNLAAHGTAGLAETVEILYGLARDLHRRIQARPAFETPFEPESNIVLFRWTGGPGDLDRMQRRLRRALMEEGGFYLSGASFQGRRWLRATVMNPATTGEHFERLLDRVEALASAMLDETRRTGIG